MIHWFIYYLFFLVIFSIILALVVTRIKILHPFRAISLILSVMALPFIVQLIIYGFSPQLPTVAVPNLVGLTPAIAQQLATDNNLSLKIKEVIPPGDTPADIILEQLPEAGSKVKTGKTIFISVSSGPQKVKVPNLIGRPLSQIYIVLQEMGFTLGEIEMKVNKEYPNNTVIGQSPEPETAALPNSGIDIVISVNPETSD